MSELLPCPFCGDPAVYEPNGDHHGEFFTLGCSNASCIAERMVYTEPAAKKEAMFAAWNMRRAEREACAIIDDLLTQLGQQCWDRTKATDAAIHFHDKYAPHQESDAYAAHRWGKAATK